MMRAIPIPVLLTLLVACGIEDLDAGPRPGFAIWTAAGETHFVDEDGNELGWEPAIVLRTPEGEHVWSVEPVRLATVACESDRELGIGAAAAGAGDGFRARLIPRRGVPILVADETPDGYNSYQANLELRASVGNLLFLLDEGELHGCGAASPMHWKRHLVWDLASRREVDLREQLPDEQLGRVLRAALPPLDRAWRELPLADQEQEPEELERDQLRLEGMLPIWSATGLGLSFEVSLPEGEPGSTSYLEHTVSPGLLDGPPVLPSSLAELAVLPPAVARFVARHPELEVRGFTGNPEGAAR